jgi:hypothetical protein
LHFATPITVTSQNVKKNQNLAHNIWDWETAEGSLILGSGQLRSEKIGLERTYP